MNSIVRVVNKPADKIVPLATAKNWLRVSGNQDDTLITLLLDGIQSDLWRNEYYPIRAEVSEFYYGQPAYQNFSLTARPVQSVQSLQNRDGKEYPATIIHTDSNTYLHAIGDLEYNEIDNTEGITDSWAYKVDYTVGYESQEEVPSDLIIAILGELTERYEVKDGSSAWTVGFRKMIANLTTFY